MPLYEFECDRGHVTEQRQGYEVTHIPCRCGLTAARHQVYRDQYMQAETGPKGGKRNPVPVAEQRLGRDVSEYEEAIGEVGYAYEKEDKRPPDLLPIAKARARRRGAKVRA